MECITIGELIESLRCEIKDPDGEIWTDDLLKDFIQQAYTHISSLRPDDFSEAKEITLERGACLHEVCDCIQLINVLSIDGNDCNPPDEESTQDSLQFLNKYFADSDCEEDPEYCPESWSLVKCGDCSSFRVDQPTPSDRDVNAIVCCKIDFDFCAPDILDQFLPQRIFNKWYEGFRHLILSKIYATDRKCEDLLKLSKLHFEYWQDFRDWIFRVDFAASQSDWELYRQKTSGRED